MSYHIFAGRFQPFHNGHLEIVEKAISNLSNDDFLVIGIVTAFKGLAVIDNSFADNAIEHHLVERNPWFPLVPLKAVTHLSKVLNKSNQIIITVLPSPDSSWQEISNWFPKNRKWIIPEADEDFDEKKADFYRRQGETVIRYKECSNVSGRELRDYFFKGDYENFKKYIPAQIADIYWTGEKK